MSSTRLETCANCKFFADMALECLRYPPVTVVYSYDFYENRDGEKKISTEHASSSFPTVAPENWCGEWMSVQEPVTEKEKT